MRGRAWAEGYRSPPMANATITRGPVTGTALTQRRKVPFFVELYRSALGKKYVMAITGLAFMGYVFAHMVGNLKLYLGAHDINQYGEFLKKVAYPILPESGFLWIMRPLLAGALVLHVHAAYSLTRMNQRARGTKYQSHRDYVAANFASRSMRWTGIIVLLFIAWHLADLTFGWVNPANGAVDADGAKDIYAMVVASFERIPVALLYIVANLALGVHLFHGVWSLFQSLGWNNPRFNPWRRYFAGAFAGIVVLGNISFPIAVLVGIVD
jgi:succinate dehydrogenase / fumarate reductase, cytochrome b subunit